MKVYLISDTHFNHDMIATYCHRPENFTEILMKRWNETVTPNDLVIHLGDFLIGNKQRASEILKNLHGQKVLVRGNHDESHSNTWWISQGFAFSCDAMEFRGCWLTHRPSCMLPPGSGCRVNIHGHLHNVWHGFAPSEFKPYLMSDSARLKHPWHRLFAVEYTDYRPVEFNKFLDHPDRYQSRYRVDKELKRDI